MSSPRALSLFLALLAAVAAAGCKENGKSGPSAKPAATAPAPTGSAVIEGVVRLDGAAPAPKPWGGKDFVGCKGKRPDEIQLVQTQGGLLENAFVYVKDGLPPGTYPAPTTPVVVDQKDCEFTPRVFGAMAEQPIQWGNSDPIMHNVNAGQFNQALASAGITFVKPLEPAGSPMLTVRCDVHPWMRTYAGVLEHPYFQVTKADGAFKLAGLVDGEYIVAVWHETLGMQEQKVKTTSAAPAKIAFEMKP